MFIRRRRLLWLIVVIGSSWIVISTYFVRSNDDSHTQQHFKRYHGHHSQFHRENSIRPGAVSSTRSTLSNDFYYDDTGQEVINIAPKRSTPRQTPTVFQSFRDFEAPAPGDVEAAAPVAHEKAESEVELKDGNVEDGFEKEKSSVLRWKKKPTPKVHKPLALDSAQKPERRPTPSSDSVKHPPGNEHYTVIYCCVLRSVCLIGLLSVLPQVCTVHLLFWRSQLLLPEWGDYMMLSTKDYLFNDCAHSG